MRRLVILAGAAVLAACASVPDKVADVPVSSVTVHIPVKFNYLSQDQLPKANAVNVKNQLTTAVNKGTRYPYSEQYSSTIMGDDIYNARGMWLFSTESGYTLHYMTGSRFVAVNQPSNFSYTSVDSSGRVTDLTPSKQRASAAPPAPRFLGSSTEFFFDSKIVNSTSPDSFDIELTLRPVAKTSDVFGFSSKPKPQLATVDVLTADVQRVLSSITPASFTSRREIIIRGEVDVPYGPDAVYSNLERKLGLYKDRLRPEQIPTTMDIKKVKTFVLGWSKGGAPLYTTIYPYRNGSKVTYSTQIDYFIRGDGSSDLKASEIDDLKKKIAAVCND